MLGIIGNILAFMSTFVVIATLPMTLVRLVAANLSHNKPITKRAETVIIAISIAIAIILIPYYHYPY